MYAILRIHKAKSNDNIIQSELLSLVLTQMVHRDVDGDIEGIGIELEVTGIQARHFLGSNNCIPFSFQKHYIAERG